MNKKEHKDVDILTELLPEIDRRNYKFFADLPKFYKKSGQEDPNKGIDFVPLLRWASCVGDEQVDWNEARRQGREKGDGKGKWPAKTIDIPELTKYYIQSTNELVNKYFWEMVDHPELLYKLFALIGYGKKTNHIWIKAPAKKRKGKVADMLKQFYPTANQDELDIFYNLNTRNELLEIAELLGYQHEQIKEIKIELKELNK